MSDAKKLRRAAADHLGCDPSEIALLEVAPSPTPDFNRNGTTTWALIGDESGNVRELLVEELLDLPTPYVVPGDMHREIAGSYSAYKAAQMGGKEAVRNYARQHSENLDDHEETERIRQIIGARIRRNAEQLLEQERLNQKQGNRRLKRLLTGQAA